VFAVAVLGLQFLSGGVFCGDCLCIIILTTPRSNGSIAVTVSQVGGRLVYSTCSLNPIENESVLAAALGRIRSKDIELVPLPSNVQAIPHLAGMTTWGVPDKGYESNGTLFASWEDVLNDTTRVSARNELAKSMFPPPTGEAKNLGLEHSMRILPSPGPGGIDGGGFFVAMFRRKNRMGELAPQPSSSATAATKSAPSGISGGEAKLKMPNGICHGFAKGACKEEQCRFRHIRMCDIPVYSSLKDEYRGRNKPGNASGSIYAPLLLDFKSPWLEIAAFFGLASSKEEAAELGVHPFPLASLCRTNFQKENLQTLLVGPGGMGSVTPPPPPKKKN
jgi:hypothetical protein